MNSHPTLTVLSLGGGVQSSVMALMASQGAFDRIPDCAIFADTHWEPEGRRTGSETSARVTAACEPPQALGGRRAEGWTDRTGRREGG